MIRRCTLLIAVILILTGCGISAQGSSIDLAGTWKFRTDPGDVGIQKGWQSPGFDGSTWRDIKVPGSWESQGVAEVNPTWKQADDLNQPYTGYAWYRRSVVIPAEWKGKKLRLRLGRIDDLDWTYVNGKEIGKTDERREWVSSVTRSYSIPGDVIRYGEPNVIAVRVLDYRGLGGIMDGPIAVETADTSYRSGTRVDANGDAVNVGGDVSVRAGETVKDAVAVTGDIEVYGHVTGDAVAVMGDINVHEGGRIDGDAVVVCGNLHTTSSDQIGGATTHVGGPQFRLPWQMWPKFQFPGQVFPFFFSILLSILSGLLYILAVALFPRRMETIARVSMDNMGYSALYGVIAWLLILPVAIVLLLTCIGIPLILVEILLAMVGIFLGKAGIALAIGWKLGEAVNKPIASPVVAVLIGALVLVLLHLIPCLGYLVALALTLIGFGAVIITGFGAKPDWIWTRGKNGTPAPE